MPYLLRQKFNIQDVVYQPEPAARTVLLVDLDSVLGGIYESHLQSADFRVKRCSVDGITPAVMEHSPRIVVLNAETAGSDGLVSLVRSVAKVFPELPILTLALGLDSISLTELMNAGASGHVDRKLTTPRDIATIIKSMLNN